MKRILEPNDNPILAFLVALICFIILLVIVSSVAGVIK